MTKQVVAQVPFLRKYTDKEKDNLANYAAKLFTLNVFYDVNKRIIKNPVDIEEETRFLVDFWTTIVVNMSDWNDMDKGELSKRNYGKHTFLCEELPCMRLVNWARTSFPTRNMIFISI